MRQLVLQKFLLQDVNLLLHIQNESFAMLFYQLFDIKVLRKKTQKIIIWVSFKFNLQKWFYLICSHQILNVRVFLQNVIFKSLHFNFKDPIFVQAYG